LPVNLQKKTSELPMFDVKNVKLRTDTTMQKIGFDPNVFEKKPKGCFGCCKK